MKKIPSRARRTLFVLLSLLFLLTGCGKELVYLDPVPTSAADTAEEPRYTSWPMPDYDPDGPRVEHLRSTVESFVETKHCIVFTDNRDNVIKKYINKANGTVHVLCGDALCKHEKCSARVNGSDGNSSMVYAPEYGLLCWIQVSNRMATGLYPYDKLQWEIVSIDIDHMDFTIRRHYISKPGDKLQFMRYDDGKLYFIYQALADDHEDEWKYEWRLDALSLKDDSVETVGRVSSSLFTVRDGVVYYHKSSLQILYSLDLVSGTQTALHESEQDESQYWFCGDRFYCYSLVDACMRELDLDGNVVREVLRADESDPDYRHRWAVGPDGTFYEFMLTYSIDTEYVADNGKIFRWVNGERELYADLGESKCINYITPIGDRLFCVVRPNNTGVEYYYVVDGVANKVSK